MGDGDAVRLAAVDRKTKSAACDIDPLVKSTIDAKNFAATSDRGELASSSDLGNMARLVVNRPTANLPVKKEAPTTHPNCLRILDITEEEDIVLPIKHSPSSHQSKLYQNHAPRGRSADAYFDKYGGSTRETGVGVNEGRSTDISSIT